MISIKAIAGFARSFLLVCVTFSFPVWAFAGLPVIPGAAGYGIDTPAGRGGRIFRVTTVNDGGPGSLRECVGASGPRVCVFEVSGSIQLESDLVVEHPRLTIAGQTAPAPGILLRDGTLKIHASDVLVQHIAVRVGDDPGGTQPDARDSLKIGGDRRVENVVIDHASFSWSVDEVVEVWGDWSDVTISNSIIAEPLHDSLHSEGSHGLAVLIGSRRNARASMIGNLIAHGYGRNPRSGAAEFAFVNNVVYNSGESEAMLYNHGAPSMNSVVGNVFIKGRNSRQEARPIQLVGEAAVGVGTEIVKGTLLYVDDNVASCATDDAWSIVENRTNLVRTLLEAGVAPAWPDDLEAAPAANDAVLSAVLGGAGTRPAERNGVDARVVRDVKAGTGQIINCVAADGSARCRKNGGGWPELESNQRALDLPSDANGDEDGDGYTNLEEWLHAMAADVQGGTGMGPVSADSDDTAPPKPPKLH